MNKIFLTSKCECIMELHLININLHKDNIHSVNKHKVRFLSQRLRLIIPINKNYVNWICFIGDLVLDANLIWA